MSLNDDIRDLSDKLTLELGTRLDDRFTAIAAALERGEYPMDLDRMRYKLATAGALCAKLNALAKQRATESATKAA